MTLPGHSLVTFNSSFHKVQEYVLFRIWISKAFKVFGHVKITGAGNGPCIDLNLDLAHEPHSGLAAAHCGWWAVREGRPAAVR